ncbi:hypothetical protein PR048_032441 [Dryococelus australis]|uniref:Uncharacterized protein n=1 Tax=Dryococelus australis TaxID=614101 RepID=A0ABQ9G3D4_9NEOP|nr:hypothetical protein PR048_032441 [Dryococelus australis]
MRGDIASEATVPTERSQKRRLTLKNLVRFGKVYRRFHKRDLERYSRPSAGSTRRKTDKHGKPRSRQVFDEHKMSSSPPADPWAKLLRPNSVIEGFSELPLEHVSLGSHTRKSVCRVRRSNEIGTEQRRNARVGETGETRDNLPNSSRCRYDSHVRKTREQSRRESNPVRLCGDDTGDNNTGSQRPVAHTSKALNRRAVLPSSSLLDLLGRLTFTAMGVCLTRSTPHVSWVGLLVCKYERRVAAAAHEIYDCLAPLLRHLYHVTPVSHAPPGCPSRTSDINGSADGEGELAVRGSCAGPRRGLLAGVLGRCLPAESHIFFVGGSRLLRLSRYVLRNGMQVKEKLQHPEKTRRIHDRRSPYQRGNSPVRWSGEIWAALNIEVLRADESAVTKAGIQVRGKWEIPEKTRRPAASYGTIPTCENPRATPPGIEPGSPGWEMSSRAVGSQRSSHATYDPKVGLALLRLRANHLRQLGREIMQGDMHRGKEGLGSHGLHFGAMITSLSVLELVLTRKSKGRTFKREAPHRKDPCQRDLKKGMEGGRAHLAAPGIDSLSPQDKVAASFLGCLPSIEACTRYLRTRSAVADHGAAC